MAEPGGRRGQLALRHLVKRYGDAVAIDGLDLDIGAGEFFCLLGASGCGKTTTLRMVAGFEPPDEGAILLDGVDLADVAPHKRPVNTVFQSYALFPFMNVADNVGFGLRYQSASKADTARRVGRALELVEMTSYATRKPYQLSGGQQQRVALARALVLEPTVLLLDEPLGALDAKLRKQLQLELRQLQRRVGTTFVYVTHDQEEALTMSDRLAVLVDGRVEQVGTPSEMYSSPASAYVAGFLGTANLLEGVVTDVTGDLATCRVGDLTLRARCTTPVAVGGPATLVVRPERVEISPLAQLRDEPDANSVSGHVESLVFRGSHTHVSVRVDGTALVAEVPNVQGALPEWLHEGRDVCTRVSHRAVQLLPQSTTGTATSPPPPPVLSDAGVER
ncbi:MAG: ABC transporter ATP-binding protein [Nocardioidaceae bacterium]